MANSQLIELQLDVINQTIEYKGQEKVIPESYWKDTLLPFLYPNWDSDKDKCRKKCSFYDREGNCPSKYCDWNASEFKCEEKSN